MVKIINKNYGNKEFKLTVVSDLGDAIISVTIKELTRPNWKIFRYSYRVKKYRWLQDFESVEELIDDVVFDYLASVKGNEEQIEKLKFFKENY
jgi:hypothetical protein